jgi:hypothetical protein
MIQIDAFGVTSCARFDSAGRVHSTPARIFFDESMTAPDPRPADPGQERAFLLKPLQEIRFLCAAATPSAIRNASEASSGTFKERVRKPAM